MFNIHAEIRGEIHYLFFSFYFGEKKINFTVKINTRKKALFPVNLTVQKNRNFHFNMNNETVVYGYKLKNGM